MDRANVVRLGESSSSLSSSRRRRRSSEVHRWCVTAGPLCRCLVNMLLLLLPRTIRAWTTVLHPNSSLMPYRHTTRCSVRSAGRQRFLHDSKGPRQSSHPAGFCYTTVCSSSSSASNDPSNSNDDWTRLPRLYVGPLPTQPTTTTTKRMTRTTTTTAWSSDTSANKHNNSSRLAIDAVVTLSDEQSHYVTSVLRLGRKKRRSSSVVLRVFDGHEEWVAELLLETTSSRRRDPVSVLCRSNVAGAGAVSSASPVAASSCWLCVAPPRKKDRCKWMVEKTCELGVTGYMLLETDFSQDVRSSSSSKGGGAVVPFSKLQAYTVEAAEQCERQTIPPFITLARGVHKNASHPKTTSSIPPELASQSSNKDVSSSSVVSLTTPLSVFLNDWATQDRSNQATLLVCRERSHAVSVWDALERHHQSVISDDSTIAPAAVAFLIGPEGGWSPAEEHLMDQIEREHGRKIYNVSLGSTVLRAETAAMTAVAAFALHRDYVALQTSSKREKLN